MKTFLSIPNAGHIFAKVRRTNPYHHFSSDIVHNIFCVLGRPQLAKTCLANWTCFSRFASVRPGLTFLEYVAKVGCALSQVSMVVWLHHPSVAFSERILLNIPDMIRAHRYTVRYNYREQVPQSVRQLHLSINLSICNKHTSWSIWKYNYDYNNDRMIRDNWWGRILTIPSYSFFIGK